MPPSRRLKIPQDLIRFVSHLPPLLKSRIRSALDEILSDPHLGKSLRAEFVGLQSLRVGRFRIIYRTTDGVIEIVTVGPRSSVYQDLALRLKRPSA